MSSINSIQFCFVSRSYLSPLQPWFTPSDKILQNLQAIDLKFHASPSEIVFFWGGYTKGKQLFPIIVISWWSNFLIKSKPCIITYGFWNILFPSSVFFNELLTAKNGPTPTPNGTAEKSADKIWLICNVGSAESLLLFFCPTVVVPPPKKNRGHLLCIWNTGWFIGILIMVY